MYVPYLMLRNLGPQIVMPAEQRRADEQLGELAAAFTRRWRPQRRQATSKVAPMPMPVIHSGTGS
jgi:hypothetical protein